jgi:glycerol kinase
MPSGLILAIDQGTTSTKALLVDGKGKGVFRTSFPLALIVNGQGQVEQDPNALWESVSHVASECVSFAAQTGNSIAAVGISNQRETAVAWDGETGEPISNAIGWQCIRSSGICERLKPQAGAIRSKTGLPLATLISGGKWAWMLENDPKAESSAKSGTLRFGTVDSWLVHRLTGGTSHLTDLSNASRTGLLNLEQLVWDQELLNLFGIPRSAMPELRSSSGPFGTCRILPGLEGIPILAAIGDSHSAMFGHGRYASGTVKATYGTGSSLMALTSGLSADTPSLARTVAWSIDGQTRFALEGNIAMTGSAVQWVGEFLRLGDPAKQAAGLAETVNDAHGVYFVPAMVGLGAPHWDPAVRGAISGLGRSHTAAHLARAAVDAIAYQVADVFHAMQEACGLAFAALHADGGATCNHALMQFQADILGVPILRSSNEELSAIGASWLAGLALGWWAGLPEIETLTLETDRFTPMMEIRERNRLYAGWKAAVKRARLTAEAGA